MKCEKCFSIIGEHWGVRETQIICENCLREYNERVVERYTGSRRAMNVWITKNEARQMLLHCKHDQSLLGLMDKFERWCKE
jgi:hypothetical protein